MILFKPEHKEMILRKKKTQTRRTGQRRWNVGSIHQAKLDYRKGSQAFAYIRIIAVREEFLGMITDEDARREGYPSIKAYRKIFKRIYGHWDPHMPVWVVDFELVSEAEYLAQKTIRKGAA